MHTQSTVGFPIKGTLPECADNDNTIRGYL